MPIGRKLAFYIRSKPLLSTLLAAATLAFCWTFFWLSVFFLSTWVLGVETTVSAFALAFWLSVLAESLIRYLENLDLIAFFAKPLEYKATGDNKDYTGGKALGIAAIGIIAFVVVTFLSEKGVSSLFIQSSGDFAFMGQPSNNPAGFHLMLNNWLQGLRDERVYITLIAGFFMRVWIYKRAHK